MIGHVHGSIRLRWPLLAGILAILHLPYGWLVVSRDEPHHPECTPEVGVLRSDGS